MFSVDGRRDLLSEPEVPDPAKAEESPHHGLRGFWVCSDGCEIPDGP